MKPPKNLLAPCLILIFGFAYPFISHAQSQGEMNMQASHDYQAADAKLNKVYKQLMEKIDKPAQAKLKSAQLAWIAFRDAQAALEVDCVARDGTMAPTIYNACRTDLTEVRSTELERLMKIYGN